MTKEQMAAALDGTEYGSEVSKFLSDEAKKARLVIVYGASDDLTEFAGFIRDEAGLGTHFIADGKLLDVHDCNCQYCGFKDKTRGAVRISSDFGDKGFSVRCSAPAAIFSIMEDGERYGDGLVFQV